MKEIEEFIQKWLEKIDELKPSISAKAKALTKYMVEAKKDLVKLDDIVVGLTSTNGMKRVQPDYKTLYETLLAQVDDTLKTASEQLKESQLAVKATKIKRTLSVDGHEIEIKESETSIDSEINSVFSSIAKLAVTIKSLKPTIKKLESLV